MGDASHRNFKSEQLSLRLPTIHMRDMPGVRAWYRKNNLFFAFLPDRVVSERAIEIAEKVRARCQISSLVRPRAVLHMSLCGLGRYETLPERVIECARAAAEHVKAAVFEIALDKVLSFKGTLSHPLVLSAYSPDENFSNLQSVLREALASNGFPVSSLSCGTTPHITLLYDHRLVPENPINDPVIFQVRSFALIHSLVGDTKHKVLGRWPLQL